MTPTQAESVTWCHPTHGYIHAASWDRSNGGCLTTIHEHPDGTVAKLYQTPTERTALRHPWRDRKLLGRVCGICETQEYEMRMLMELQ